MRYSTPFGRLDVVSGSGAGLTRSQREVPLRSGEMYGPNLVDVHAEVTGFRYATVQGWQPLAGGTSRPVCRANCLPWIELSGGRMTGPVEPRTSATTTTQQRSFVWPSSTRR